MDRVREREAGACLPSLLLRVTNLLSFALFLLVNAASQFGLIGEPDIKISQRFPTPLTPASWAFSAWLAVYTLQLLGVVYAAAPQGYNADGLKQRYVNGIGYGWQLGWAAEMAWQLLFQLQSPVGMALCLMSVSAAFIFLARTLFILYRLKDQYGSLSSVLLYMALFLPTSINAAWLSVTVSVGALMVPVAFHATAHMEALAVVLASAITVLGVLIVQRQRDSAYGLTLVWALVAVYGGQQSPLIRVAALVCVSIMTIASIFSVLRRKQPGTQTELSEMRQPLSLGLAV